jgi:hypothetical protein
VDEETHLKSIKSFKRKELEKEKNCGTWVDPVPLKFLSPYKRQKKKFPQHKLTLRILKRKATLQPNIVQLIFITWVPFSNTNPQLALVVITVL